MSEKEAMSQTASYAIDSEDRIAWTDDGFATLAEGYGRPELGTTAVGRPLLGFVAGERPRELQNVLIGRARAGASGDSLMLRYRCDAPEMRRFAVLELVARPDDSVVFTTWFEATEGRPYQPLLDSHAAHDATASVRFCAWCNRIDPGDGWREAEELEQRASATAALDHTVCEICELLLTSRPGAGPTRSGPSGRP